jgi:hypothetical protein
MAEVGLLPFARIALHVSKAVLPRYRSRFSKHQFTQSQLLAILCLMRYEDWTFREAEVRLGEHRELRQALGLTSVPDFTTLYRFLQRLDDQIHRPSGRRNGASVARHSPKRPATSPSQAVQVSGREASRPSYFEFHVSMPRQNVKRFDSGGR